MKMKLAIGKITLCAAVVALAGCSKQQPEPAAPPAQPAERSTPETTNAAEQKPTTEAVTPSEAAQTVTQAVGQAVTQAVSQLVPPSTQGATQAAGQLGLSEQQAQGLLDRAKGLVADQKYQDALSALSQLTGLKLTPEQQKFLDNLKAQIQGALATNTVKDAASALSGALGGKK